MRLLRALGTLGVYERQDDGRYALTELGATLRTAVPGSVAGWARLIGRHYHAAAWTALADSVWTGENAYPRVHGMPVWDYRPRWSRRSSTGP